MYNNIFMIIILKMINSATKIKRYLIIKLTIIKVLDIIIKNDKYIIKFI